MRKIVLLICVSAACLPALAQKKEKTFAEGSIVLASGTTVNGFICNDLDNSRAFLYREENDKIRKIKLPDIASVQLDGRQYRVHANDLYEQLQAGPRLSLYRKAYDGENTVAYNGNTPVIIQGVEGRKGSYYVLENGNWHLIDKKNYLAVLNSLSGKSYTASEQPFDDSSLVAYCTAINAGQ